MAMYVSSGLCHDQVPGGHAGQRGHIHSISLAIGTSSNGKGNNQCHPELTTPPWYGVVASTAAKLLFAPLPWALCSQT